MKPIWKRSLVVLVILTISILFVLYIRGENQKITKRIFAMDTYMDITAYGKNGERAVEEAIAEIHRLDALLSTGKKDSEVTRLNEKKEGILSEDYAYLLKRSVELWNTTEGAFDITVYPIMRAWGFVGKEYRIPEEGELASLLQYVNTGNIFFEEETRRVVLPQKTEIDFGGIAKGYTAERVAQLMRKHGVKSAILNLGGNVQAIGKKQDGSNWKVAIKSPDTTIPYLGILNISDKAVITSGGYERFFEKDGKIYEHIIDPKTGKPVENGVLSVTIVCEDATMADGLSTALYVMGREKAVEYWQLNSQDFDIILYEDTGKVYVSEGLKEAFSTELEYEIISER